MKSHILFTLGMLCLTSVCTAQNTFPANGNVGIGLTDPTDKFQIEGNQFSIRNATTNNGIIFNVNAFGHPAILPTNGIGTMDKSLLLAPYGGNIGIGLNNPTSKLDVFGNITSFNAAFGQTNSNTSTKNYANFSSNNHGTVLMSSNLFFSDNDDLKIANTHPSMSGASVVIPGNGQNHQGGILFYTNTPGPVTEGQAFTGMLSMTIKANGDVGIGTGMPREKLSVNGNIRAREIKVEATNWPDYVFEKGYKVGTLEELESYIKANKHLPDMPTAKDIEANGLELGEVVKMQQKKIEELTLHLIEKDKQINNQNTKVKDLESRLDRQEKMLSEMLKKMK
ncbi:hypothetical protein ACFE6N_23120 [Pedobacter sp. BG31]|uniref:hypothetical protein n=1 Tax=Pedobacter sp. BG31 TaxID=3349697 RepID=UPI0035F49CB7